MKNINGILFLTVTLMLVFTSCDFSNVNNKSKDKQTEGTIIVNTTVGGAAGR